MCYRASVNLIILVVLVMTVTAVASPIHAPLSIGFRANSAVLLLRAVSTGCTRREDFRFSLNENRELAVTRIRPDTCRARPRTVQFEYSFDELGLDGDVFTPLKV